MNPSPKTKAIVVMFMFIVFMYVVYIVNKAFISKKIENFEQEDIDTRKQEESEQGSHKDPEYSSRMYVMKMFEGMFNRKPTADEIEKYSGFGNEKSILTAILEDYDRLESAVENKEALILPSITESKKERRDVLPFDEFAEDTERILDDEPIPDKPQERQQIKQSTQDKDIAIKQASNDKQDKKILREKIANIEIALGGLKDYLSI